MARSVVAVAVIIRIRPLTDFAWESVRPVVHRPVAVGVGIAVAVGIRATGAVSTRGASGGVAVVFIVFVTVKVAVLGQVGEGVIARHGHGKELRSGGDAGAENVEFPGSLSGRGEGQSSEIVEVVAHVGPGA